MPASFGKNAASADPAPARRPVALLLEKNPPPVEFKGKLKVWRAAPRNPRLVVAYLPETDPTNPLNLVSLMVADNARFLPGMLVPGPDRLVVQTADQAYVLQGALPRWRGRW